ncbi:GNAT family N-acetyltransferase [Glycomyces xiaoerkulensis]|uniref:GNAT family N-acetyltransferase n=1 Tax=Glycomyces xiaoerkulensis TaxID=2038139 RepID=UPI000C268EDE|nr:GNAT family N-acetyltransferase [Glycomyces xiaoerkulensis]
MPDKARADRAAAGLLAAAFDELPTARWLVPDPAARGRAVAGQFELLIEHARACGGLATAGAGEAPDGALVWFDYTGPVPPISDYRARLAAACGAYTDRFLDLDAAMDAHHPSEPHHYIALIGVRPDRRGQGIATALLDPIHRRLDRAAVPAYLEAVSVATMRLYRRLGYRPHGRPYPIGPGGPPLYPMWREPNRH